MKDDPNESFIRADFPKTFTLLFGMKMPLCPTTEDASILSSGPNGFEIVVKRGIGMEKCRIMFKKYDTDKETEIFDTEFRPFQTFEFTN